MTRDEVMAMTDEELQIKAAELMGIDIVCLAWPILKNMDTGTIFLETLVSKVAGGWLAQNKKLAHVGYAPVMEAREGTWPPSPFGDCYSCALDGLAFVPDYPNDITAAAKLFGDIPGQRIIEWEEDGTGHIDCRLRKVHIDCPRIFFDKDEEARAIVRVFILAMEPDDARK